jgi:Na+-driven multidrug efflux pump
LSSGVVLNVLLNYFLIPVLGIEGASIATLMGYVISDIICVIVLCKMKLMVVSKRFIIASLLIVAYMIFWRMWLSKLLILGTLAALCLSAVMSLLYKDDLVDLLNMIKNKNEKTNNMK